jgi:hypothetical protein
MTKDADSALLDLLRLLAAGGYHFVTPTPATHGRVIARHGAACDLRDVLGWSLPFATGTIDPRVEDLLRQANALKGRPGGPLRSRLRVSSLRGRLFLHSAYPTDAEDSIFFGPDSYRFAELIAAELQHAPLTTGAHIVDMGAGAGVGGIVAGLSSPGARVTLTDLNPKALRLARINAAAAGVEVTTVESDTLDQVADPIDLAVINPPYIIDDGNRAYRDGGGMHGSEIPLRMTEMAAARIAPRGRVLLYTGAAIVNGGNALYDALARVADARRLHFTCRELDPDVFGEELDKPAYAEVERIALVAVTLSRP